MTRPLVIILVLLAPALFPKAFTILLVLVTAFFVPLAPLGVGILVDTLYYTPHVATLPLFSLFGSGTSVCALLVRRFIETSIMRA